MAVSPHPTCREPLWRPARQFFTAELPPAARRWLLDDGSLTRRLAGQGRFRVQRLRQEWCQPLPSERQLLGLPNPQVALVRQVILWLEEQPVVFARSVFPVRSVSGPLRHLRRLQHRSLGSILFSHPGMRRSPFELAQISGDSDYLPPGLRQVVPAWGRRSRFVIQGRGLLVSEVFLRDFRPWPASLPLHRSQRGRVSTENSAINQ